jgi:iron complex transport system substrate-binding protein
MMSISKLFSLWFLVCCFLFLLNGQAYAQEFPKRIVSLGPINTENVFLLEAGDRLVANTNFCVRPAEAKQKEKIGSVMQVSIEKIISQQPDLVLATALTKPEQVRQLQAVGIKVVRFKRTASFREICDEFIRLGELLGLADRARAIVDQAQAEVAKVEKKVFLLKKKKVFLQVGSRPLFGAVSNSFTNDFIVLAGGINILAGQKSGTTGIEKVIGENPDLIIIAIMGSESGIAADEKKNWQRIPVIKAVQEDRVHIINPDLVCSPSPATFAQTLQIIAGLIHPEITTGSAQ